MVILINGVPSGGGASLPTAPLGQVLISQGDGVPPIFSPYVDVLSVNGTWAIRANEGKIWGMGFTFNRQIRFQDLGPENLGELMNVMDATVNTVGAVIAGGGTFNVLARWNGTNWKVVAG
jgi:hypothetical protein